MPDTAQMGRPSSYDPDFVRQAEKLCQLGATNAELADFFEVSVRTIERWQVEHEDFCRAIKLGKEQADDRVERSLYQRAIGYSHDAEKIMQVSGEVVRVPFREHYAPDPTSMIFWLKNRRKEQWRDKQEIEHSGEVEVSGLNITGLAHEKRVALLSLLEEAQAGKSE